MQQELADHWTTIIERSGKSAEELSLAIGKDRSYLRKTIKGRSEPSISVATRLADALDVPLEYLLGRQKRMWVETLSQTRSHLDKHAERLMTEVMRTAELKMASAGFRPTIDHMLAWWHAQNGRLAECSNIEHHFDLIKVPEQGARSVEPHVVGPGSYAARKLKGNPIVRLFELLDTLPEPARIELAKNYFEVAEKGQPRISKKKMTLDLPQHGICEEAEYFHLQLPVVAASGDPFILSYCVEID